MAIKFIKKTFIYILVLLFFKCSNNENSNTYIHSSKTKFNYQDPTKTRFNKNKLIPKFKCKPNISFKTSYTLLSIFALLGNVVSGKRNLHSIEKNSFREYSSLNDISISNMLQTNNSGIFLSGSSFPSTNSSLLGLKLDSNYDFEWDISIKGTSNFKAFSSVQINNDKYIIVGQKDTTESDTDIIFSMLDSTGNEISTYSFGAFTDDYASAIIKTNDDGAQITGLIFNDIFSLKINPDSSLASLMVLEYPNFQSGECLLETMQNKNIVITGKDEDPNELISNGIHITKMDLNTIIWQKIYRRDDLNKPFFITETKDLGYLLIGSLNDEVDNMGSWVIKTDYMGRKLWANTYNVYVPQHISYAIELDNEDLIFIGATRVLNEDTTDILLFGTDKMGDLKWSKTLNYYSEYVGKKLVNLESGNILLSADSTSKTFIASIYTDGSPAVGCVNENQLDIVASSINNTLTEYNRTGINVIRIPTNHVNTIHVETSRNIFNINEECTFSPSISPTNYPTNPPTLLPTLFPTLPPTFIPTSIPTTSPTLFPTPLPTLYPSYNPTLIPTLFTSSDPSFKSTTSPTFIPSTTPTNYPLTSSTNYSLINSTHYPLTSSTNYSLINSTHYPLTSSTDYSLTNSTHYPLTSSTDNPLTSSTNNSYSPVQDHNKTFNNSESTSSDTDSASGQNKNETDIFLSIKPYLTILSIIFLLLIAMLVIFCVCLKRNNIKEKPVPINLYQEDSIDRAVRNQEENENNQIIKEEKSQRQLINQQQYLWAQAKQNLKQNSGHALINKSVDDQDFLWHNNYNPSNGNIQLEMQRILGRSHNIQNDIGNKQNNMDNEIRSLKQKEKKIKQYQNRRNSEIEIEISFNEEYMSDNDSNNGSVLEDDFDIENFMSSSASNLLNNFPQKQSITNINSKKNKRSSVLANNSMLNSIAEEDSDDTNDLNNSYKTYLDQYNNLNLSNRASLSNSISLINNNHSRQESDILYDDDDEKEQLYETDDIRSEFLDYNTDDNNSKNKPLLPSYHPQYTIQNSPLNINDISTPNNNKIALPANMSTNNHFNTNIEEEGEETP